MTQQPFERSVFFIRNPDDDTRRRGRNVVAIALLLVGCSLLITIVGAFIAAWRVTALLIAGLTVFWLLAGLLARSGRVTSGAMVLICTALIILVAAPVLSGHVVSTPFFFLIPITIGFATLRVQAMWLVVVLTVASIGLLALLTSNLPPIVSNNANTYSLSILLTIIVAFVGLLGARTTERALSAAAEAQRKNEQIAQALHREKESLAERVLARTADLDRSLEESRQLTAEQARLLAENTQQRDVIRRLSVPVLPVDAGLLVIPLIGILDKQRLDDLSRQALSAIQTYAARRLLLDVTGVSLLDREVAESLLNTMQAARLLGAEVALVGIRPEVAQTLVELDLDTNAFQSFSTLQTALHSLRT